MKPGTGILDLFGYFDRISAGGGVRIETRTPKSWGDGSFFGEGWIDRSHDGALNGGVLGGVRWRW